MEYNIPAEKPKQLFIKAEITGEGIDIFVNNDLFPIIYPAEIWEQYGEDAKQVLLDNIAYSATVFLPQILDLPEIKYATARPSAEPFLFENGIYDMPSCAVADKKSSLDYIKKFFNTLYVYANNEIKMTSMISKKENSGGRTAIIPFSFGKESLLNFSLCRELGITPILVNVIEPSNKFEYFHKKELIKDFEKEFNVHVYTLKNYPGYFRYGRYWGLNTELGWGLHTTEYCILMAPFAKYFNADYIVLGNERSCNDIFFDNEGVLVYKAGYDQYRNWTPQQGLLASLVLGRRIDVISLVEPLYEIAETKILHTRYPEVGKYQMSCFADNDNAAEHRWCQSCVKCGYMYALASAFNIDIKKIGFTKNLFDEAHAGVYNHFFGYDPKAPEYGSQEELGLAFYLAAQKDKEGVSIERFKKELGERFIRDKSRLVKEYLGIHKTFNIPASIKQKIYNIYHEELNLFQQNI